MKAFRDDGYYKAEPNISHLNWKGIELFMVRECSWLLGDILFHLFSHLPSPAMISLLVHLFSHCYRTKKQQFIVVLLDWYFSSNFFFEKYYRHFKEQKGPCYNDVTQRGLIGSLCKMHECMMTSLMIDPKNNKTGLQQVSKPV